MKRLNYVLPSWSGQRYCPGNYLKRHIAQLNSLRHKIDQVTVGYPHNPSEAPDYTEYVASLTTLTSGAPIVVVPCENNGRSYGQFNEAFKRFRGQFQYWTFIEDDYAPFIDDFDDILINMFEEEKRLHNCGYLCQCAKPWIGYPYHAAISNGITDNASLERVWARHGILPHDRKGYVEGQVTFSRSFINAGMALRDMKQFKAPYWNGRHLEEHNAAGNGYVIVPYQMLPERQIKIL